MKFPKTKIKSTETQFENARTQFQKCENSIYRGTYWRRLAAQCAQKTPEYVLNAVSSLTGKARIIYVSVSIVTWMLNCHNQLAKASQPSKVFT